MFLAPIDIVFLLIIFIFAIMAVVKGFVKEFLGKLAFIGGIALGIIFTPKLESYIMNSVHNQFLAKAIAFLLIFVIVFLIVSIIKQLIGKVFDEGIMKGLDKALGFFWGIVEGLVIVSFIIMLLTMQTWFDLSSLLNDSFFFKMLSGIIKVPADYLRGISSNV